MPLTTTKTFTDAEGNVYPYLLVNLAISPLIKPTDVGGSVAMTLTPYRENPDGSIVTLPEEVENVVYYDVYESAAQDPVLAQAVTQIMDAIQYFVNGEGL